MMNILKTKFLKKNLKINFQIKSQLTKITKFSFSSSDTSDQEIEKKNLNQEKDLYDLNIIKSLNFKKIFNLEEIQQENTKEENFDNDLAHAGSKEYFDKEMLQAGNDTEMKINIYTENFANNLKMQMIKQNIVQYFEKDEQTKNYVPKFINKNDKNQILTLEELKHFLIFICIREHFKDNSIYENSEYLIRNFVENYFKNLDKMECINFKDFSFLIKINIVLKSISLDNLIVTGLSNIFKKPFDEISFTKFTENNPEYKEMINFFHIFFIYFSEFKFIHQMRYYNILTNIIESLININKLILSDFDNLFLISDILKNYEKDNIIVNYDVLMFKLKENFENTPIPDEREVSLYIITGLSITILQNANLYSFEDYLTFFKNISESMTIYENANLNKRYLKLAIRLYFNFLTQKMNVYEIKNSEKFMEYNQKILNYFHEQLQKIKFLFEEDHKASLLFILRSLVNLSLVRKNKLGLININYYTKEAKSIIDGIESPSLLLNIINISYIHVSSEEKHLILSKIYNNIPLLKNLDFHDLNVILSDLVKMDGENKKYLLTFRDEFMNKLFYAYISGVLFDEKANLKSLLYNIKYFFEMQALPEETMTSKKNKLFSINRNNMTEDQLMNEIRKGDFSLTPDDISDILDKIYYGFSTDNKKIIQALEWTKSFVETLCYMTFNCNRKDELFKKYYKKVIYPFLVINFRSLDTFINANAYFIFLNKIATTISQVEDGEDLMDYHLKLMTECLLLILKNFNTVRHHHRILSILNNFYKCYMFNPNIYEMVEKKKRRHKFLKVILRKRFILGRSLNIDGPVKVSKGKDRIIEDKLTTELTDNYFFG